jgi:hypothetical protein
LFIESVFQNIQIIQKWPSPQPKAHFLSSQPQFVLHLPGIFLFVHQRGRKSRSRSTIFLENF